MTSAAAVAEMTKNYFHVASVCSNRSLALAPIQTRRPGALTGWKKCLQSSMGYDLPAIPSKTAPIEEKEFRNMCHWVYTCRKEPKLRQMIGLGGRTCVQRETRTQRNNLGPLLIHFIDGRKKWTWIGTTFARAASM